MNTNIDNIHIINTLIPYLEKYGIIDITYDILNIMHSNNSDYVHQYCSTHLPRISWNHSGAVVRITSFGKTNKINLRYLKKIAHGSYNTIKLYKSESNDNLYNLKYEKPIVLKESVPKYDKHIGSLFIDIFMHALLSAFQEHYNGEYNSNVFEPIIPIYMVAYNIQTKQLVTLMPYMEYDLYHILDNSKISDDNKYDIFIKCLFDISCYLSILQKFFNFVHYDLKSNNILCRVINKNKPITRTNLKFYIADFGSSRLQFGSYVCCGISFFKTNHTLYSDTRDIYQFMHLVATFISNNKLKNKIVSYIDKNFGYSDKNHIRRDQYIWQIIYTKVNYHHNYNPINTINIIMRTNNYTIDDVIKILGSHCDAIINKLDIDPTKLNNNHNHYIDYKKRK